MARQRIEPHELPPAHQAPELEDAENFPVGTAYYWCTTEECRNFHIPREVTLARDLSDPDEPGQRTKPAGGTSAITCPACDERLERIEIVPTAERGVGDGPPAMHGLFDPNDLEHPVAQIDIDTGAIEWTGDARPKKVVAKFVPRGMTMAAPDDDLIIEAMPT